MVVSLPPTHGYRLSEAAAALNRGRSSSAFVYCVGFDTNRGKFELAAGARKRKLVFLRNLALT